MLGHDPTQKESDMSARHAPRARETLGTLFNTVYRVTREKDEQAFAVTNSIEFKLTSTHSFLGGKNGSMNKVAGSTDSFDNVNKVSGKSAADSVISVV